MGPMGWISGAGVGVVEIIGEIRVVLVVAGAAGRVTGEGLDGGAVMIDGVSTCGGARIGRMIREMGGRMKGLKGTAGVDDGGV